ncbi:MAG: tetratricopeptide repeat protein [Anaerolineae bacterium]|nr:tetratricopeptide repeat protein [Anaerolineae bacterium]
MQVYAPGTLIASRYEVASRPLMGEIGLVYFCLDRQEDRPVALKTLRPEYLPDHAARDRFLREGAVWANLGAHPHIVRCYGVEGGGPDGAYLVLELVAKGQGCLDASLRSCLAPGCPLPLQTALFFAIQIARGMCHAVERIPGFVHRDLKPENIFVGGDRSPGTKANRVRVSGFGLLSALRVSQPITDSAMRVIPGVLHRTYLSQDVVGTPLYMAPEVWWKRPTTTATDVYALGCILCEMLTGEVAAEGDTFFQVGAAHCKGLVASAARKLPPEVRDLAARCLAYAPTQRYNSWADVEADLTAVFQRTGGYSLPAALPAATLTHSERVSKGWSYNEIGAAYLDLGQADLALKCLEQARAIGDIEREFFLQAAALSNLGLTHTALGNAERVIGCYEQALAVCQATWDRRSEATILGNLGNTYTALGKAQRAIETYERALAVLRELADRGGEGQVLNSLGGAHWQLGYAHDAIAYYEQALAIARETGDRREEGLALANMGTAHRDMINPAHAIDYYEQALAILGKIGDPRAEANLLGCLGLAYNTLGDPQRALACYAQALATWRRIGDESGQAMESFNMALIYRQESDLAGALPHAQEAVRLYERIGHAEHARRAQRLLAQLQRGGTANEAIYDEVRQAFKAFLRADSPRAMRRAAAQFSLIAYPKFLVFAEQFSAQPVRPKLKQMLQQRLAWLRQVVQRSTDG